MWSWLSGSLIPDATSVTDPLNGIPINFVSKIAIVGNIAGSRVFSVENNALVNQDVGYSYKTVNHPSILNMLRRNIALMSRNISDTDLININSQHDFIIKKDGSDYIIDGGWFAGTINGKRSVIVIGGDIILNKADINSESWSNKNIALIALKDAAGNGGNIIITDQVKRIYAYMYAEGVVFSGEKPWAYIRPYSNDWIWNIPKWQIYIRGLVASKNTIGGSQQKPTPICPVLVSVCNTTTAYEYDWDYFRTYNILDATQGSLPTERAMVTKLQSATMIIEYDPQILTDPPPWFREQ